MNPMAKSEKTRAAWARVHENAVFLFHLMDTIRQMNADVNNLVGLMAAGMIDAGELANLEKKARAMVAHDEEMLGECTLNLVQQSVANYATRSGLED